MIRTLRDGEALGPLAQLQIGIVGADDLATHLQPGANAPAPPALLTQPHPLPEDPSGEGNSQEQRWDHPMMHDARQGERAEITQERSSRFRIRRGHGKKRPVPPGVLAPSFSPLLARCDRDNPSMPRRDTPLSIEIPPPEADKPAWAKVGIIAAAGFALGIVWPRLTFDPHRPQSAERQWRQATSAAVTGPAAGAARALCPCPRARSCAVGALPRRPSLPTPSYR